MLQAIVNITLDKRNVKFNGKFPVKLIVYHDHKNKRYSPRQKVDLSEDEWNKINALRLKHESLIPIKNYLNAEKARAQNVIKQLGEDFSYETFEALFIGNKSVRSVSRHNVYNLFDEHIKVLAERNSIGTAESYRTAKKSIEAFAPTLLIKDVTPAFLEKYERHMVSAGKSITTVGIYLRSLRTILNLAKDKKLMTSAQYPFGQKSKKKYEIPVGRNIKKALTAEDIRKIRDAQGLDNEAKFARDIWLFSFYCNGMNVADICRLTHENIQDGFLHFIRRKTIRTQREQKPIEVFLSEPALEIIETYRTHSSKYLFGIIDDTATEMEQYRAVCNFNRSINHYVKSIARSQGIECNVTTYVARHSYATLLRNMGVSVEEISENLGHSNVSTTKSYLDSFPKEHKKETATKLAHLI